MTTWFINDSLYECPLGWQRFILDLENRLPFDSIEGYSVETLNRVLEPFQARVYESGRNSFLDFADERCYTLFVLKYGGKE